MALRKCASCGGDLPAGSTARAKFCSSTCRKRASRVSEETPALALVPPLTTGDPAPVGRLKSLTMAAERLERLLDEADPRSAAALNKEYRDTLREIDSLRDAGAEGGHERTGGGRRPFEVAAI